LKFSHQIFLCISHFPIRATCLTRFTFLGFIIRNNTWWRVKIMKLIFMQFSPFSCCSLSLCLIHIRGCIRKFSDWVSNEIISSSSSFYAPFAL
jgi:hypothetical protein